MMVMKMQTLDTIQTHPCLSTSKGDDSAAPGEVSSAEAVGKVLEFKSPQQAGVLLSLDGLSSAAARISFSEGQAIVTDRRFFETKEVIEWAMRSPILNNEFIEVRQIQEIINFPEDARGAAKGFENLLIWAAAKP
jgi:hypothetical protein